VWWLLDELSAQPATVDGAVIGSCLLALVGCVAWGWLTVVAVALEAWLGAARYRTPAVPHAVRRLLLAACGVAVAGALAHPASALDDEPRGDPLAGLPLPQRAVGAAHRPAPQSPRSPEPLDAPTVVVRAGDCLWSLAAEGLGPDPPVAAVDARWRRIYRLNRSVIGPRPDLIRPGQLLQLPPTR
jgi:hypothetical protein